MEIGLGDLLEALQFEQTLSTSMSEARNLDVRNYTMMTAPRGITPMKEMVALTLPTLNRLNP